MKTNVGLPSHMSVAEAGPAESVSAIKALQNVE